MGWFSSYTEVEDGREGIERKVNEHCSGNGGTAGTSQAAKAGVIDVCAG
jgi:hypothetical protein